MANLTENAGRSYHGTVPYVNFDVGPNQEVFAGQAMIAGANGIVNLAASGEFVGFADEYVNNLTNVEPNLGANRATTAKIAVAGYVWMTVNKGSTFVFGDVGSAVYATDGNTFDLANAGTDVAIGKVVNVDAAVVAGASSAEVLVQFGLGVI